MEEKDSKMMVIVVNGQDVAEKVEDLMPPFFEEIYEEGRKRVFDSSIEYFHRCRINDGEVESLEEYSKRLIDRDHMPDWISVNDFRKEFADLIEQIYEEDRAEAVSRLEKEEQ